MRKHVNKLTSGSNLMWEASRMMLPEHKEAIIEHYNRPFIKAKPVLDEQRLEELSYQIQEAIAEHKQVAMELFAPLFEKQAVGYIAEVKPNRLKLVNEAGVEWIALDEILNVRIQDSR